MVDTAEQVMVMGYKTGRGVDAQALANRQALIQVLDQLQRGEEEGFWALFDPEASFHEASCLPYGGSHHGIEAIKTAFYTMCATFSAMHTEFHEVLTAGDYCILYQSIRFTVAANGNEGGFPVAEMFRFRNGRIVEWRANYFDACLMAKLIKGEN